jgi:endonuclease/exonuclease/phosphatase family metal-dependent hydrolase
MKKLLLVTILLPTFLLGMKIVDNVEYGKVQQDKAQNRINLLSQQINPVKKNRVDTKKLYNQEAIIKIEQAFKFAFEMGDSKKQASKTLLWEAAQKLDTVLITQVNKSILCKAVDYDRGLAVEFAKLITKDNIFQVHSWVLQKLLKKNDAFVKQSVDEFMNPQFIKYFDGLALEIIIDKYPECTNRFTGFIKINGICGVPHLVLHTVYSSSEENKEWLRGLIAESIKKIGGHEIIEYVLINPVYASRWFAAIGLLENDHDLIEGFRSLFKDTFLDRVQFWKKKKEQPFDVVASASSQHLMLNWTAIGGEFANKLWNAPELRADFFNVLTRIGKEQQKGRHPFVHAQKGSWSLYQDIFKELWQIFYDKKVDDDYWFFRFDKAGENMPSQHQKTFMKNLIGTGFHRSALYMNYPLFGSTTPKGSSSIQYALENHDYSSGGQTVRGLFEILGFEAYYDTYKDKLDMLEQVFKKVSFGHGTILVVSLSPEQLKESVRTAREGGAPQPVLYKSGLLSNLSEDVLRAVTTYDTDSNDFANSDMIEFFAVLADGDKGLLNPDNPGIRTYDFRSGDFTLYKKCLHKLFADIAEEIAFDKQNGDTKKLKELVSDHYPVAKVWENSARGHVPGGMDKRYYYKEDCKKYEQEINSTITTHDPKKELRIVTYNVHCFNDRFGLSNVPAFLKNIQTLNPDVVCLQEFVWQDKDYTWNRYDSTYLKQAFAQLGYLHGGNDTFALGHPYGDFGNVIFSKYPLKDIVKQTYSLPAKKNKGSEQRNFVGATVMFNDKPVRIYTTHLDVYDASEFTRLKELEELNNYIVKHDKDASAVFITGDFNAVFESDYQYTINNKRVWDLLKADDASRGVLTPTIVDQQVAKWGYQDAYQAVGKVPAFTTWPGKVVDKGFLFPNSKLKFKNAQIYMSSASDHLPVIFDLTQ